MAKLEGGGIREDVAPTREQVITRRISSFLKSVRDLFRARGRGKFLLLGEILKQHHFPFMVEALKERWSVDLRRVTTRGGGLLFLVGGRLEGPPLDPPMEGTSAGYRGMPSAYTSQIEVFIRSSTWLLVCDSRAITML